VDRPEIKQIVKEIFGPNTPMTDTERWVSIPCPLSPWTHARGQDTHPSAGISVKTNGEASIFNCFTCHSRGTLSWLLRKYSEYSGEDWLNYAKSLERGEFFGGAIPVWDSVIDPDPPPVPIDKEKYFDLYDPAYGHSYLAKRGITREAARRMELLYDPGDSSGVERIMFPVYGPDGLLYGFSGRAIHEGVIPKVKDYHGLPKRKLLLGAHLIEPTDEYVILVEGLFDYAKMVTYGFPAMAFMGSYLTETQADIVRELGKPVYFFHDDDPPGRDARDRAKELLWRYLPLMKVRYPSDPTVETAGGGFRAPKDPAELSEKQVRKMLNDARLL
jgi:hypothetical protein